jgi:hypothetical protein
MTSTPKKYRLKPYQWVNITTGEVHEHGWLTRAHEARCRARALQAPYYIELKEAIDDLA